MFLKKIIIFTFLATVSCQIFVDKIDNECLNTKIENAENDDMKKCLNDIKMFYSDKIGKIIDYRENCKVSTGDCSRTCAIMGIDKDCIYLELKKTQTDLDREKNNCEIAKKNACHCSDYIFGICVKNYCSPSTQRCKDLGVN